MGLRHDLERLAFLIPAFLIRNGAVSGTENLRVSAGLAFLLPDVPEKRTGTEIGVQYQWISPRSLVPALLRRECPGSGTGHSPVYRDCASRK